MNANATFRSSPQLRRIVDLAQCRFVGDDMMGIFDRALDHAREQLTLLVRGRVVGVLQSFHDPVSIVSRGVV